MESMKRERNRFVKTVVKLVLVTGVLTGLSRESFGQQPIYEVTMGNGNGIRFWQNDLWKMHMGNSSEYQFGPVTDYSIKINMDGAYGRGWTWGVAGQTPIAALSNNGQMQLSGSLYAGPVYSNSGAVGRLSVSGGTGELSIINRAVSGFVETPTQGERWVLYNGGTTTDGKLRFWTGGDRVVFTKEGNVGVGTNQPGSWFPSQTLEIFANRPVLKLNAANSNDISTILFTNASVNGTTHLGEFHLNYQFNSSDNSKSRLRYYGYPGEEILTLEAGGNIGIGTTTPQWKLDVHGQIALRGQAVFDATATEIYVGDIAGGDGLRDKLSFWTRDTKRMTLDENGNVGIGTITPGSYKLAVEGKIGAREVNVTTTAWSDYVFNSDYKLRPLAEVQQYIEENHHLPEVPSEKEVLANGQNLGEMNAILLKKIEELTLYQIESARKIEELRNEVQKLTSKLN